MGEGGGVGWVPFGSNDALKPLPERWGLATLPHQPPEGPPRPAAECPGCRPGPAPDAAAWMADHCLVPFRGLAKVHCGRRGEAGGAEADCGGWLCLLAATGGPRRRALPVGGRPAGSPDSASATPMEWNGTHLLWF